MFTGLSFAAAIGAAVMLCRRHRGPELVLVDDDRSCAPVLSMILGSVPDNRGRR